METKTALIGILIGIIAGGALIYTTIPRIDPSENQSQIEELEASISSLQTQNDEAQSQMNTLQSQISSLQSSLSVKNAEISSLDAEVEGLTAERDSLSSDVDTLIVQIDQLEDDYSKIENEYNLISQELGTATAYLEAMSEGLTDYFEFVESYLYTENSFSRIFTWDEVSEVSDQVREITGTSTDLWESIENIYNWIDNNVVYSYDPEIPFIDWTRKTTFEGITAYTSFQLSTFGDHKQTMEFTLEYLQGDCDDQAALTYAMIKYYMIEILGTEYNLYLIRSRIGTDSGHLSLLLPVQGGKVCIIDPVGDDYNSWISLLTGHGRGYLTKSSGPFSSITSKLADEELENYSDRYASEGGITYLWLYDVEVDDGSYRLITEGTLNQVASFLSG